MLLNGLNGLEDYHIEYKETLERLIKLYKYFNGEQLGLFRGYLDNIYQNKTIIRQTPIHITNLVGKIVDLRAETMDRIEIKWKKDKDKETFDKILGGSARVFLGDVNKQTELFKTSVTAFIKDPNSEYGFIAELLKPYEFAAEVDKRSVKAAKLIEWDLGRVGLWRPTAWQDVENDAFVIASIQRPELGQIYSPVRDSLLCGQESINHALFCLNAQIRMQGYSQPWVRNPDMSAFRANGEADLGATIEVGPDKIIKLEQNGDFGYATPDSKVPDIITGLESLMKALLSEYDISYESFTLQNAPTSGFSLKMRNLRLERYNSLKDGIYVRYIRNLIEKANAIQKVSLGDYEISVRKNEELMSETEKIRIDEHDLKYNMTSPVELLAEQLNITAEEAVKRVEEYMEQNSKYKSNTALGIFGQ